MYVCLVTLVSLIFQRAISANVVPLSSGVFSVHWVTNTTMEIQLPYNSTDTILLSPPTDIPDPDTPCLFTGRLEQEEHSRVTVLGCKDSQKTIITIASTRIPGGLVDLKLEDGVTNILDENDMFNGKDDAVIGNQTRKKREADFIFSEDDVLEVPIEGQAFNMVRFTGPLPDGIILETDMMYDNSFLTRFNGNHKEAKQFLGKVLELTRVRMVNPTLKMSVYLKKKDVGHLNELIKITDLSKLQVRPIVQNRFVSFFCSDICVPRQTCTAGIAYVGSACSKYGYSININNLYDGNSYSEISTARIWAHELGHNLGMRHDFDQIHGGHVGPCNGKGLMSYRNPPDVWSDCSNKDFENFYRNTGYTCLDSAVVNGGWSSWTYGGCSKTCGGGTQRGTRSCNNPKPSNGGKNCAGSGVRNRQCNTNPCQATKIASDSKNVYYKVPIPYGTRLVEGAVPTACRNVGLEPICWAANSNRYRVDGCLDMTRGGWSARGTIANLVGCDGRKCKILLGVFFAQKGWDKGECGVLEDTNYAFGNDHISGPGNDYHKNTKTAQYFGFCGLPRTK